MGNAVVCDLHEGACVAFESEGLDLFRIMSYCSWAERATLPAVCREVRHKLGYAPQRFGGIEKGMASPIFWKFLCERLSEEHNVYVPSAQSGRPDLPPRGIANSWRDLFLELFPVRVHLDGTLEEPQERLKEQLTIKVAARFRSSIAIAGEHDEDEEQSVVLPLHQKVQIVRNTRGCSKKEALEIIMREAGHKCIGDPFKNSEMDDPENKENDALAANSGSPAEAVVSEQEQRRISEDLVDVPSGELEESPVVNSSNDVRASILAMREDTGSVLAVAPGVGLREFTFDHVFSEKAKQADAYDCSAHRLVMDFLNGINTSIICYGQTGSGKTYTMFGPSSKSMAGEVQGIVPRACREVLQSMQQRRDRGLNMSLGLSYVEVFGSEVSDLLKSGRVVGQANSRATDRVGHRYVLDGRTECLVESWEEVQELLVLGDQAKRMAATAMNERSTRAHTLLVLSLMQELPSGRKVNSRLFLADLGGSEKVSKSKADAGLVAPVLMVGGEEQHRVSWAQYYENRQRLQETQQINKGLFALKQVIDVLHQRQEIVNSGLESPCLPWVPYQNSKLTMLLRDALGGTSRTLVFCTATMDTRHASESLQTLRFGERCAQVRQSKDSAKAASVQAALQQLEEQIQALEEQIVKKERWETRLIKRKDVDTVAGAFGDPTFEREEVIPTSVLVGAEKEREELETLLQRQLDLQGLGGFAAKDYRDMQMKEADDGGKGLDFRNKATFHNRCKAKDFEEEGVVVTALRFFFRRAKLAESLFGETQASRRQRQTSAQVHEHYFVLGRALRAQWEDATAKGVEKRSFGKAMLDLTQEWSAAFKDAPERREEELLKLVAPVPELVSLVKFSIAAPENPAASSAGYPSTSSSSTLRAKLPSASEAPVSSPSSSSSSTSDNQRKPGSPALVACA